MITVSSDSAWINIDLALNMYGVKSEKGVITDMDFNAVSGVVQQLSEMYPEDTFTVTDDNGLVRYFSGGHTALISNGSEFNFE